MLLADSSGALGGVIKCMRLRCRPHFRKLRLEASSRSGTYAMFCDNDFIHAIYVYSETHRIEFVISRSAVVKRMRVRLNSLICGTKHARRQIWGSGAAALVRLCVSKSHADTSEEHIFRKCQNPFKLRRPNEDDIQKHKKAT